LSLEYEQSDKYSTFTDPRDGKKYKTVKIGEQIWMAENLAYDAEGSVCYDNDPANGEKYGRLYSFGHIKESCPTGWHVPTRKEWNVLEKNLKAKSGFSALPAGYCDPKGKFHELGSVGTWWSYSVFHACSPIQVWITSTSPKRTGFISVEDCYLFSIRCVKDSKEEK